MIAPNKLNCQFNPEEINRHGLVLCSHRVISWAFSDRSNSGLTVRALRLTTQKRKTTGNIVFHSDQGCQYTSGYFQRTLLENGIESSMSRRGDCLDNAVIERFFRNLKSERINYRRYGIRSQAVADIIDNIESFYNQKRKHCKLGNISPAQYEMKLRKAASNLS